jgi:hypothetical protein
MVQAILAGRKTQTRRTRGLNKVNEQPSLWKFEDTAIAPYTEDPLFYFKCDEYEKHVLINSPFGKAGDVLWVRESFLINPIGQTPFLYKASSTISKFLKWKPSIHMPKEAARIFLKIKDIRVERLFDISESDAIAEGIDAVDIRDGSILYKDYRKYRPNILRDPNKSFLSLWESINGVDSLNDNHWVWVIKFERIEKPENFV